MRDFIPTAPLTSQPYLFVVGKRAGITSIRELTAAAKVEPGALTFGSMGIGTGSHLGVEKFNLEAGIKSMHVPAGPTDAIADSIANTVAGRTTYAMWPIPTALPQVREGGLIGLAVSSVRRSRLLPEVPTVAEAGVAGYDFPIWYGIWTPAATPPEVVGRIARDIAHVLAEPDLRDSLASHGGGPMSMTQADFQAFVLRESDHAAQLRRALGSDAA